MQAEFTQHHDDRVERLHRSHRPRHAPRRLWRPRSVGRPRWHGSADPAVDCAPASGPRCNGVNFRSSSTLPRTACAAQLTAQMCCSCKSTRSRTHLFSRCQRMALVLLPVLKCASHLMPMHCVCIYVQPLPACLDCDACAERKTALRCQFALDSAMLFLASHRPFVPV